jgi:protein-disulfide isomerase
MTRLMSRRLLAAALLVACVDPPGPRAPAPPPRPVSTTPVDIATPTSELVPVHADDPSQGPRAAAVTIVLWSDFQCPFCSRVRPTMLALRERYGSDVRIVWKDNPLEFHKHAREAAVIARIVYLTHGNEAFWQMHDRIFDNQTQLSAENLHAWAAEIGVDESTIAAYRAEAESKIDRCLAESKQLGISGTPSFFIDGQPMSGAQKFEKFGAVIDTHLAKARELSAQGVPPGEIYPSLVKTYWKQPAEIEEEEPLDPTVWKVEVGTAPTRGAKSPAITIVTFGDFQCPFCRKLEPTLAQLDKEYAGKIRFVWKDHPLSFHNRALPAAEAAREVRKQKGDDAFWKYHDALFTSGRLDDVDLLATAATIDGIDTKKVQLAIEKSKYAKDIDLDVDQAEALKVSGTPHSFVNGRAVNGNQPLARWKKVIDEELAKGTRPYDDIIKTGKFLGPVDLKVPADAPFRGGAKAKVVLQVFSDFQCPFCRRLARPIADTPETGTLEKLQKKYGDKIKIVWRDFPLGFHARARAAANFAREAKKQKGMAVFWKVHDDLFDLAGQLEDDKLEEIAKRYGIDWPKAKAAIDSGAHNALIDADMLQAGDANVTGTPATVINGKVVVGSQNEDVFIKAIDRALAKTTP